MLWASLRAGTPQRPRALLVAWGASRAVLAGFEPILECQLVLSVGSLAAACAVVFGVSTVARAVRRGSGGGAVLPEPPADQALGAVEAALSPAAAVCALVLSAHVQAWFHVSDIPYWSQWCMVVAAWALMCSVLVTIAAKACTSKAVDIDEIAYIAYCSNAYVQGAYSVASLVLHGVCAAVCVGIVGLAWRSSPKGAPPAVACSAGLTVHFFAVRLALVAAWRTLDRRASRLLQALRLAASTVFLAPMLSVLFLGDRIRAIQLGRPSGNPQPWAQAAFYVCSFALVAQTALAVVVPMMPGGDARFGTKLSGGDVEVTFVHLEQRPAARLGFALLRLLPCALLCAGVPAVVVSIVAMEGPRDAPRPPLPTSLVCMIFLAVQFLGVHIGLWTTLAVRDALRGRLGPAGRKPGGLVGALLSACAAVRPLPVLSALFVSLRLRAEELFGREGEPQAWAQVAMCVTSAAATLQLLCHVAATATALSSRPRALRALEWSQAAGAVVVAAGVLADCAALLLMAPATAPHSLMRPA